MELVVGDLDTVTMLQQENAQLKTEVATFREQVKDFTQNNSALMTLQMSA